MKTETTGFRVNRIKSNCNSFTQTAVETKIYLWQEREAKVQSATKRQHIPSNSVEPQICRVCEQSGNLALHACFVTVFLRHLLLVTLGSRITKPDRPLI